MWWNILISVLGSETIKVLVKRAFKELRVRTDTSIDAELAEAVIMDIAESNGNKLTKDVATAVISTLKEQ